MNTQPILTSSSLELRPLRPDDYDDLLCAASDPLIWEQHPQPDRYQPHVFKDFFAEAISSDGALAIIDRKNAMVIGTSRYYDHSTEDSSILVGYTFLSRQYWGGVYNRDLKKLMVNYALQFVKKVYFQVGINNKRSQKAMIKIGAINTGIQEVQVSYAPPKKSFIYRIDSALT